MISEKQTFVILVAFVLFAGVATSDRLPSQVPENQIFTIDTLVDATGIMDEKSSLDWTLDDQNINITTANYNQTPAYASEDMIDSFDRYKITYSLSHRVFAIARGQNNIEYQNRYLTYIEIPDYLLNTPLNTGIYNSLYGDTYGSFLDYLQNTAQYAIDSKLERGNIHDGMLNRTEEIMILTWSDSLQTNGGRISFNKNIDFDSQNKARGQSNLQVEKVLTYADTEGSHLLGGEEWTLDVAGNYDVIENNIRCVFASAETEYFPAFCNVVKSRSELVNINSARISTKGSARGVAATGDIPSALNYQIAVTPDSESGSGFAEGTVKTLFGGSIMEAREMNNNQSATNNWKDTSSVTGGITNFQKTFTYESGFKI